MKIVKLFLVFFLSFSILFMGCKPKDTDIETNVNTRFKNQPDLSGVTATVVNGVATLSGDVKTEADKNSAETIANEVNGVDTVHNNISLIIQSDKVNPLTGSSTGLIADDQLMDSAKAIAKDYPDINVSVSAGVITVTGIIAKEKKDALMQSLKLLSNHGITDQLELK